MRYRFLASVALAALIIPLQASSALAGGVLPRSQPACHCAPAQAAAGERAYGESFYNYQSSSRVDYAPYSHRWQEAPQGPVEDFGEPPPDLPPYGDGDEGAYEGGYSAYAHGYGYRSGIQVDQDGWQGGVGYSPYGVDAGGGGGGGGGVITFARPDGLNGPSYNSFGQSYGGAYGAANRLNAWRGYTPSGNNGY